MNEASRSASSAYYWSYANCWGAAVPAGASLQDLLLDLISKRTGYPLEMLELDQNLEA